MGHWPMVGKPHVSVKPDNTRGAFWQGVILFLMWTGYQP